jgi:hypothetical protein
VQAALLGPRLGGRLAHAGQPVLRPGYYRLDSKGHRVYNGYHEWSTFLGINRLKLAARSKHFKARPGRYLAVLRATDESNNTSKPVTKGFEILGAQPAPARRPGPRP